jgi:hypothetical protein
LRLSYAIGLIPCWAYAQQFSPECPREAITELIQEPRVWADRCFMAVNGRPPDSANIGEADSDTRDIDLDGNPEHLEIRGTGNASKQIYVFRQVQAGFEYLGRLDAHPSFIVELDANGVPTIEYEHRFGADDIQSKRIQYIEGRFVEVEGVEL